MSALRKPRVAGSAQSTRQRKVACPDCGCVARMTRSWMERGLPTCACGAGMRPESPADLAWIGLIGPDDMPAPMWTAICRENGWDDAIQRKGAAANSYSRKLLESGGIMARVAKPQCSYAGCGRWTRNGAEFCHEHSPVVEACPF